MKPKVGFCNRATFVCVCGYKIPALRKRFLNSVIKLYPYFTTRV